MSRSQGQRRNGQNVREDGEHAYEGLRYALLSPLGYRSDAGDSLDCFYWDGIRLRIHVWLAKRCAYDYVLYHAVCWHGCYRSVEHIGALRPPSG